MLRKLLLTVTALAALFTAVPALAQSGSTRTVTVTEAQVNATYRVTNPARQSVSDVFVDLQPGQVAISATFTPRRGDAVATVTTLVPAVDDGRVYWTVLAVTANGQPASAAIVAQVNTAVAASWQRYVRQHADTGRVIDLTITAADLTLTFDTTLPTPGEAPVPPNLSGTVTVTEAQVNAAYVVSNPARQSVSDVYVDLQPGQVAISATFTPRRGDAVATVTTLVPSLEDGRVYWTVGSVTVDGQPASADLVAQVNTAVAASWRRYFRETAATGRVTDFTLTDSAMSLTFAPRA